MMGPLAVVAVGGNALVRGQDASVDAARAALAETADHLATMVEAGWALVITHGNGPQVGFGLLRSEAAARVAPRLPLDVIGAETQGSIGYLLQQALDGALARRGLARPVATVVTRVVVDPADPSFARPTKPVGPFYRAFEADALRQTHGWAMVEDAGRGWRRVVPSPVPLEIVEAPVVRALVDDGIIVIAAGGGGIPVARREARYEGVEAVVDKDAASAILAQGLRARLLVFTTAVEQVALDFGTPAQRTIARMTADEARRHLADGQFPPGSMGPKIQAAIHFVESGGEAAVITSAQAVGDALRERAGTRVVLRA
jgi:carbamate kinase